MLSKKQDIRHLEPLVETLLARSPGKLDRQAALDRDISSAAGAPPELAPEQFAKQSPEQLPEHRLNAFSGYRGRRFKAALLLMAIWSVTGILHLVDWGIGVGAFGAIVLGFTAGGRSPFPSRDRRAQRQTERARC